MKEFVIFCGLIILGFSALIVWAWDHDEKFYQDCHESGGVVIRGYNALHCMHPSAFIELKD